MVNASDNSLIGTLSEGEDFYGQDGNCSRKAPVGI